MANNRIPLAIGFNPANNIASGLEEFLLPASSIDGAGITNGYVLTARDGDVNWEAGGGGGGGAVNSVNTQTGDVSLYLSSLSGVDTSDLQEDHHIIYDGANWTSQYSQKLFVMAYNPGALLSVGDVVYVSDVTPGGVPEVSLARADSSTTMPSIGVVAEGIGNTQTGPVISFGTALGLTFDVAPTGPDVGKTVYVSPINAGQVTLTKPTDANHLIQNVGILVDDSPIKVKVTGVGRANDVPNSATFTGDITLNGGNIVMTGSETVDGRDLSVDGAKLDGIENLADVTDATNVAAAGALMNSSDTVSPDNLVDSAATIVDGELVKRTSSSQFTGVTTTAGSETFLGTAANFANLNDADLESATDGDIIQLRGSAYSAVTLTEAQNYGIESLTLGNLGNVESIADDGADIGTYVLATTGTEYSAINLPHSDLTLLDADDHTQYVLADGTRPITGNLSAVGVSATSGEIAITPTAANHIANKSYVDSQIPTPSYFLAFISGAIAPIADEVARDIAWSLTGAGAISDPAGNVSISDTSSSVVDIAANGVYQIDCSLQASGPNGRVGLELDVYINTAGDGFVVSSQYQTANYATRGVGSGENIERGTCHMNTLMSLNNGDSLQFWFNPRLGGTSIIPSNGTYLRIIKIA